MPDIDALSDRIFGAVQEYLGRSLATFSERLKGMEARLADFRQPEDGKPGERGEPGEPGQPGKDVDPTVVNDLVAAMAILRDGLTGITKTIDQRFAELPKPKDGEPGKDGKDVDPNALEELRASVGDMLKHAEEALDSGLVELASAVQSVKALPIAPASFFIDDKGDLVAVYPDGTSKAVGAVRGKDGTRGASVMDGSVDATGQLTFRMSDGRLINAGMVRGEPGKPGEGKSGAPGRDATELQILPAIDESKEYPAGTTAAYKGGLIRAERSTAPIVDENIAASGWRVILEGIAGETEDVADDGRVIERTTTYTGGRKFRRRFVTATMIYRGVWADGQFSKGDAVTWDGSLWHCEKSGTHDKPGISKDWRLVAKRGRDGNDLGTPKRGTNGTVRI